MAVPLDPATAVGIAQLVTQFASSFGNTLSGGLTSQENAKITERINTANREWMTGQLEKERQRADLALTRKVDEMERLGFNKMMALDTPLSGGMAISGGTAVAPQKMPLAFEGFNLDPLERALSQSMEMQEKTANLGKIAQEIENLKAAGIKVSREAEKLLTDKKLGEEQILEKRAQTRLTEAKTQTEKKQALLVAEGIAAAKQDIQAKDYFSLENKHQRKIQAEQEARAEEELRLKAAQFDEQKYKNKSEARRAWTKMAVDTFLGVIGLTKPIK